MELPTLASLKGKVIFRQWSEQEGLREVWQPFESLEELFALCVQPTVPSNSSPSDQLLVDRVVIEGQNSGGENRAVTLVFQSLTLQDSSTS
jgi:hypothetical protein